MQKKLTVVLCSVLMTSGTVFAQNLPLSAGSSYPLTGDLHFSADQSIKWGSYYFSTSPSTGNMLFNANSVTFNSGLNVGGNITMNENATVKTIWNSGYGGAVQLLRSDANSNRWARIGIVDNGGNWVDGVHISSVGNVGLGTTSPGEKLTINGAIGLQYSGSQKWHIYTSATNDLQFVRSGIAERMIISSDGLVGIGTLSPSEKLTVNGNILAKKLRITQSGWPDYVFAENYKLKSLASVESFIKQNGHLPDVPSATEVENKGLDVGDNQAVLLKKIEELTLYVIDLQKQVNELKKTAQK